MVIYIWNGFLFEDKPRGWDHNSIYWRNKWLLHVSIELCAAIDKKIKWSIRENSDQYLMSSKKNTHTLTHTQQLCQQWKKSAYEMSARVDEARAGLNEYTRLQECFSRWWCSKLDLWMDFLCTIMTNYSAHSCGSLSLFTKSTSRFENIKCHMVGP